MPKRVVKETFSRPKKEPKIASRSVSPSPVLHESIPNSPEIKPFNVNLPNEISLPSPRVSQLSEEERRLRKEQEEADYE